MAKTFKIAVLIAALLQMAAPARAQVTVSGGVTISGGVVTGAPATAAPVVNLSAASLAFGNVVQNVTSAPQVVTLFNVGTAALTITSIVTTGNFANTTTCGGSLADGANCIITVTFTPLSVGTLTGAVTITDNAAGNPHVVSLTGTGTSPAAPDCGLTADTTNCGNVGTVTPLPSPTSISACNTSLAAGAYLLTQDVGSSAGALCFAASYAGTVKIDFGGHTVTGSVDLRAGDLNGMIVQNGTVNCNSAQACIYMQGDAGTPSVLAHVNHLTVNQSALNSRGIFISWTATGAGSLIPGIEIDHVEGSCIPGGQPSSPRNACLAFSGPYVGVHYDNDKIILPATAGACQGLVAYEAPHSLIENNYVYLQDPMLISTDSCRGILFDSDGNFGVPGTGGNSEAKNNYIHAGPNRAVRVRAENNDVIDANTIVDANLTGRLGAIHIGEPTVLTNTASATVFNNTIEIKNGNGLVCAGPNTTCLVYNNTATCTGGTCTSPGYIAFTDALAPGYAGGVLTIKNTVVPGGYGNAVGICGTSGTPTCTVNTDTSTGFVCNTGTVVSGVGATVTVTSPPCP